VVFDVDGVLTGIDSVWRYVHEHLGVWPQARMNKKLFESGSISYEEWARRDVALWRGRRVEEVERILRAVEIRPGAAELVAMLKKCGVKVFALSAGIDLLVEEIAERLGLDDYEANRVVVEEGVLTGEVKVTVGFEDKGRVFRELVSKHGVGPGEAVAVGDSIVDLPMFREAGFAVAYNPSSGDLLGEADSVVVSERLHLLARLLAAVIPCED